MKRFYTCILLLVALMVGTTAVMAQKSVLDENFGDGSLPSGWTTAGSFWNFSDNNAKFTALVENGVDTLFSPVVNLSELDNQPSVKIAYSNTANGANINTLRILYRATEQDAWAVLQAFENVTDGEESWKGALPSGLSSVQIALAGAYLGGLETRVYRLSIENKTEAANAPDSLYIESLTTNSVTLWWTVCSSPKFVRYNLKVNSAKMTDLSVEADVLDRVGWDLTDEFYELDGLTPNTEYWVYVQYDCGDGDLSPWAELSFRTPCAAIDIPFAENFEGELSNCFTIVNNSTAAAVSSEYPYNSTKSFKFVNGKGTNSYLFLPELNGNIKNCQISFAAAAQEGGNTYARTITIGVSTDATAENFTEVSTLNLPAGRKWENITVSLAGYTGSGKYIGLRAGNADKENRIFVDNIRVEAKSACPKPMFVSVSEIAPESAKISWTKSGSETEWNLVVSTIPLADPEDIEPDASKGEFADAISSNPYVLTGLKANTTYYAYLQAGCGSSEWTSAVEFKTAKPVLFPYSEHFDRMNPDLYTDTYLAVPDGWVMDVRNAHAGGSYFDQTYTSSYNTFVPYMMTTQNHENTAYVKASLQIKGQSDGTSSTNANVGIAIMPAMPEGVIIKNLMVSFWALSTNGTQTVAIGVAKTQTNDLAQGQQLGDNITVVNTISIAAGEWKKCNVLLKDYTGEGRYIVFSVVPPTTATPTIYIDDIEIDYAPDCNPINGLAAEALSVNSAKATWTDGSSATSWKVKVSSSEIDPSAADGDIANETVSAKEYTATGLAMGTTYYFYVSPACGDMWESTTVTTLVGLQVPYYNDFQSETQGNNASRGPKNWVLGNINITAAVGTQTNIPYVYNTAMTGAPAGVEKPSLYFYHTNSATSTGAYAIMPELLNADVKDLKIMFYGSYNSTTVSANYSKGMIRVGVVNSPSDINKTDAFSKVTLVKTLYCSAPKITELFTVDMSSYAGSGKYIVFYSDTAKYNYFLLDNLSVSLASAPQKVSDFVVSAKTETTATFTWAENGNATKWDVRVFAAEQADPDAGTPVWAEQVTSLTATATGLSHSTQYYAYVRAVQDNGNGDWSAVSFWTETGEWALPFAENFDSYVSTSSYRTLPEYYYLTTPVGVYTYVKDLAGGLYLYNQATSSVKTNIFAFPPFNKPVNTLQMTFIARSDAGTTANESAQQTAIEQSYTEIGVLEDDNTFTLVHSFRVTTALEWEEQYVNFQSYTGTGKRIAIRADYNKFNKNSAIRIDDVLISEIPTCGRLMGVEVSEIDSTSASLSWNKTKTETAWNLKVSSRRLNDPDTETADGFDGQVTAQTQALNGLFDDTYYYVYIQPVDAANSCVGDWSSPTKFRTLCKKQVFPYYENFDEGYETGQGKDLRCLILSGQDANHSYIASRGATGNKALYLRQAAKDHNNYLAFPALSVDSVKRLQLSMRVNPGSTTTSNYYYYEVGVMTNPNDPTTFVSMKLDSVQGASSTTFYDRAYTFENYVGDDYGAYGTYIALHPLHYKDPTKTTYYAGYVYVDDVTIDFIETCAAPTDLTADSLGIDTVKLIWKSDDKSATHRVRIFDNAAAKPNDDTFSAEAVVNDSVAILAGLTGNTIYYAYVRKECGGENGNSKWCSVYQFKTNCPEVNPLPYSDDFEIYASNAVPDCWTALDGPEISAPGGGGKIQGKAYVGGSTSAASGSKGLLISSTGGSTSGDPNSGTYTTASIVTPALDVTNLNELLVYFDCKPGSAGGALKIEAVSDNTEDANAIVITQISDLPNAWGKVFIKLGDYYTSVQPYKYLRFTPAIKGKSIYIDNIVFTKDLSVILPVENLTLQMLTENSIKFSFEEPISTINQWQVAYVVAGGDIADATIQTIDATEYTITGLASNTSYDIYVRSSEAGDEWVGPLTATTFQTPTSIPYETGFENNVDNGLWAIHNVKTVQGAFYPNFFIVGDAAKCNGTGENALFVTDDSVSYSYHTYNTAASDVWATRNIKIDAAGTYRFSFKVKVPGNKDVNQDNWDNDYATAHLFPAGATFKAATATMLDGTTRNGGTETDVPAKNIYSLMGKTYQQDDWEWVSKTLDVSESGIYSLAIYWYNASVGALTGQPVAVDSVIVEEYLCTTPKNFEYVNRAATAVTLKWFGGKCKDFEYVVSRYANLGDPALIDAEDKVASGTLTEGPQVAISNLLPNTNYSLYVRTICPEGYTDWVEFDFETPCMLESLPYIEAFTETPECWILNGASVGTIKIGTSSTNYEVWNRLTLNATSGMAILPELDVDLRKVEVEMGIFNTSSNYGAISLGIMDNTWDVSTFHEVAFFQTAIKTPNAGSTYTTATLEVFNKMLNLYQGTGKVLAIKNATANTIGIKYVKLTELPDCVKPQQVELTYPTENAVTVNWIAGVEDAWEIKLNDSIIENVTTNPYRITGLEQGTTYAISVRAICDATHTSDWSTVTSFQTTCGINSLPLTEDFSSLAQPMATADLKRATLICWDNMVSKNSIDQVFKGTELPIIPTSSVYVGDAWVSNWINALGSYAQLHSYRRGSPTYRYKWFVSPQFAIEGEASLSFDIRVCNNVGNAAVNPDRTFVAISTDNGASWKKADATQITDIDSVYTTKSISLDKYAGQNIRIAFYDENVNSTQKFGEQPFLLIDNVRMNCTDTYPVADNACQGVDYEGNGFAIAKEDLPVEGQDSTYYRFAKNDEVGCDSIVALTITTHVASPIVTVYDTICEGQSYTYGGQTLTESNPDGQPYHLYGQTVAGCDSIIDLYLNVLKKDTIDQEPLTVPLTVLPYKVDDYYTIPVEGTTLGQFEQIVPQGDGCVAYRYFITIVEHGTGLVNIADGVDYIDVYDALGRKVQTLTNQSGVVQLDLPVGMYMIRTTMLSGDTMSTKIVIK